MAFDRQALCFGFRQQMEVDLFIPRCIASPSADAKVPAVGKAVGLADVEDVHAVGSRRHSM